MNRYISDKLLVEYLEIAKVACTSIKHAILSADGIRPTQYIDYEEHWRRVPPIPRFRFTFVRHPVTRFASFYRDKVLGPQSWCSFPQRSTPLVVLQWIKEHIPTLGDKHFLPQKTIRNTRHRAGYDDFVGHYETLSTEWATLQIQFGLPDLPLRNPTHGFVTLTPACYDLIWEIYKPDFQAFGYDLKDFNDASILSASDV